MKIHTRLIALFVLILCPVTLAELKLPAIFSDHMVLQREQTIPVWGWADPDQAITVQLLEADNPRPLAQAFTVTNAEGKWRLDLPAQEAGGPYTLKVQGGEELTRDDVYVGEVWLCGGQSNMEWPVRLTNNAAQEAASATDPLIRHIKIPKTVAAKPHEDTEAAWVVASPDTVPHFTAVGYYFARELRQRLGVPVGLINDNWGGTRIEPWMPPHALEVHPPALEEARVMQQRIADFEADPEAAAAKLEEQRKAYEESVERRRSLATSGGVGIDQQWFAPERDTADWFEIDVPGNWESKKIDTLNDHDGVVWFRREVTIPQEWVGQELTLNLGPIDDVDTTYVNGFEIGKTDFSTPDSWLTNRRYTIPSDAVRSASFTIAVRIGDWYGGGGFGATRDEMWLSPSEGGQKVNLAGNWIARIDQVDMPQSEPAPVPGDAAIGGATNRTPTALYNGMIVPVLPYAIRGAIWYQGESNAGESTTYRKLMPALIEGWRKDWNNPDMPFGIVQLANFMAERKDPIDSGWAELRDAQLHTAKTLDHVGLAVIIDIGDANDIHPRNKQDVGHRLVRWAMADAYGKPATGYSGPMFKNAYPFEDRFVVTFDLFGSQLAVRGGGELTGFAIAGEDKVWHWAKARIEGDRVEVWCDEVPNPVAVRYGWADNPTKANLVNAEQIPASPFRTDDWNVTP